MPTPLKVLILEDRSADAELMVYELERAGFEPSWQRVESEADYLAQLQKLPDIILADHTMPHFGAPQALDILKGRTLDIPFIVVTGSISEEVAVERIKQGAADYILKDRMGRLGQAVKRALEERSLRDEKRKAEEEIQRNLARIRALHEIDLAITSTLNLPAVLKILLAKIDLFLPFPAATTVRLFNKASGNMEPIACRNLDEKKWKTLGPAIRGGRAHRTADLKAPLVIPDLRKPTEGGERTQFYLDQGLLSYAGIPLTAEEKVLGVLSFYTKQGHQFTREEIDFLTTLAGQAAIAIRNSQLHEEIQASGKELESTNRRLEKSLRELSSFYSALAPLAPSESVNRLMDGIIARLMIATGTDAALIRIQDNEKGSFPIVAHRGFPEDYLKASSSLPSESAVEVVFQTGEAVIAANIAVDPRLKGRRQVQLGLHSCAMLPLKVQDKMRGVVHLSSRELGYFSDAQKEHLMTIARQMSTALENRELFDVLTASRDELQRANKIKDEFLSVMSHELRTPLNVVVGYAGMIRDGLLGDINPEQEQALQKMINRANDQLALVNNILYATVLETEKINVESHAVVLGDFLTQLSSTYENPLNKQLTFNWDCPSPLAVVHTDSAKLKQILQNLVDNAIKFTGQGSVTTSARIGRQFAEFRVADTGVGIPKEHLPYIFEKFRQVDSSETRLFGGVGMGLYIVKKFTELLGGTVEVKSEVGQGSTFTVRIPLQG